MYNISVIGIKKERLDKYLLKLEKIIIKNFIIISSLLIISKIGISYNGKITFLISIFKFIFNFYF